jgi:Fe2+ transport system protein B
MPGIHMLGRSTEAEQQVYDELLGRTDRGTQAHPDGLIAVVDAAGLDRQLYLAGQLIDLRLPLLLYVSRIDQAREKGLHVDVTRLSSLLGIETTAGNESAETALTILQGWFTGDGAPVNRKPVHWRPSLGLANAYNHLDRHWIFPYLSLHTGARLVEGLRLITVPRAVEEYREHPAYEALERAIAGAREKLESRKENWTMAEVLQRHATVQQIVQASVRVEDTPRVPDKGWLRALLKRRTRPGESG